MSMNIPKIYGFNTTSEAGNNKLNFSIFLKGCNLKCPYCMNSKLVLDKDLKRVSLKTVKQTIIKDKPNMVMISGGEPLLSKGLYGLVHEIKSLGCKVGISTNGLLIRELENIITFLDYVALDIKTSRPLIYDSISDNFKSLSTVLKSKEVIRVFCPDYEIRTTLYPLFIDENDIHVIGNLIEPNTNWYLQQFRITNNMLCNENVVPYSEEKIRELLAVAKLYTKNVQLRYV